MGSGIKAFLAEDWLQFERLFAEMSASRIDILNKVNKYLVERSGKQLRPMLCLLAARLCAGECNTASIRCAVASEMIHTATLIHDDVADESSTRRGSPTVSALLSPSAAVLVGDYWLSRGVWAILDADDSEIFRYFTACLKDLAEGEMFQIEKAASLDTTYDDYIFVIAHKTASLFCAAMKSGARSVIAEQADGTFVAAQDNRLKAVEQFAYHLGLAFQMRDDIMDYSPQMSIGKPTGVDIAERKITLPLLGAIANAGAGAREQVVDDIENGRFTRVIEFVAANHGLEYAQKVLENETSLAVAALDIFEDTAAKTLLKQLALSLCLREV